MRLPHSAVVPLALILGACASSGTPTRSAPPAPAVAPVPRAAVGTAQRAIANLAPASATLVSGRISLQATTGGVRLTGTVGALTRNGAHALQVHAVGDCSAVDARSAGGYFDASGRGAVGGAEERIVADPRGVAQVDLLVPGAVLGGGAPNDIAGRALVVLGATSGATGARVACGVVKLQP